MTKPAARTLAAAVVGALTAMAAAVGISAPAQAQIPYNSLNNLSALNPFSESRYAAIVVDANTGEVLYSRYADAKRHPASITKLMTLYLTFEQLQSGKLTLNDPVPMTAHCAAMMPTKLGLRPGEAIPVNLAIQAAAIKSTNDVACALGEKIGGSESQFGALMTLRARELGMTNSNFVNASGVPDERQIASARDIAILSRALMRDFPQYYHYFSQRSFVYRGQVIPGHNHLLDMMAGVDGLKTGYTNGSGFNIATSAVRNGRRLIAVVMGGSSASARDNHMEDLLQAGFTVLAKRDQGQTVQFAQNLFEPEPTGPITQPMTAQGDDDTAGQLRIVVDQALPKQVQPYSPTRYPAPDRQLRVVTPQSGLVARPAPAKPEKTSRLEDRANRRDDADADPCDRSDAPVGKGPHGKRHDHKAQDQKAKGCATAATHVAKADAREGGWTVQVGAYKDKAAARSQLAKVSAHVNGRGSVDDAGRGMYRARFTGLSAADAKSACLTLKRKGQDCAAYEG